MTHNLARHHKITNQTSIARDLVAGALRTAAGVALVSALLLVLPFGGATAVAATPTAAQLQMLRQLSPQQLQELQKVAEQRISGIGQGAATAPEQTEGTDDSNVVPEDEEPLEGEQRVGPDESLIIDLVPIDPEIVSPITAIRAAEGQRVYRTDGDGGLDFPGIGYIPLAGLTAEEARLRVASEPLLDDYAIDVFLLPLRPSGIAALEPFGYGFFEQASETFSPTSDVPVPDGYVVGPGDSVSLQLYGKENASYEIPVNRDGMLNFPGLGPIAVSGLTFSELKRLLVQRVSEQMIGVQASVSLGELRSIRVFVLGDVTRPGSHLVSSFATMTSALYAGGGIAPTGSLRRVQLKRSGKVTATLDLYDLLLRGDSSRDAGLQPGDVVFVPPLGATVAVAGEVKRPAIYELQGESSLSGVLDMAGGLAPTASRADVRVGRIDGSGQRTLQTLDVDVRADARFGVRDGDAVTVLPVPPEMDSVVYLEGHVRRPGAREFNPGMSLRDLLPGPNELLDRPDLNYVVIRRESGPDRRVELLTASLVDAWSGAREGGPLQLRSRDRVVVFGLDADRAERLKPYLEQASLHSGPDQPVMEVRVGGRVKAPGTYPYTSGMRVSDLIRAAGGLDEAAFLPSAELFSYEVVNGVRVASRRDALELDGILSGSGGNDIVLKPHDFLNIKEVPEWQQVRSAEINGEVRFPGVYPVRRGETLRSLLERAGGMTELSFPQGSVFLREDLRRREQEQLDTLAARLEGELANARVDDPLALKRGEALLSQLRNSKASGRLVIDLNEVMAGRQDVLLKDGDRLMIPEIKQEVTVIGEVQFPTSHIYEPNLNWRDYVARSGGLTLDGDLQRTYIVRANGGIIASSRSNWFRGGGAAELYPGDTIVVPLDADRVAPLTLWTNVTQILYNLGIAAAAVARF